MIENRAADADDNTPSVDELGSATTSILPPSRLHQATSSVTMEKREVSGAEEAIDIGEDLAAPSPASILP